MLLNFLPNQHPLSPIWHCDFELCSCFSFCSNKVHNLGNAEKNIKSNINGVK